MEREENKKEGRSNHSFWIFIVIIGLALYMLMGGVAKCMGGNLDDILFGGDSDYQYQRVGSDGN